MRIKGIDTQNKSHWLHERPNQNYVWGDESGATELTLTAAKAWSRELKTRDRYLDREDRMHIVIERSPYNGS